MVPTNTGSRKLQRQDHIYLLINPKKFKVAFDLDTTQYSSVYTQARYLNCSGNFCKMGLAHPSLIFDVLVSEVFVFEWELR